MFRGVLIAAAAMGAGCGGPLGLGWDDASSVHKAAYRGDVDTLQRELDRGADPNNAAAVPEFDLKAGVVHPEWTPLELAVLGGNCDAVNLLLDRGAKPDEDLLHRVIEECPACLRGVLERGVSPESLNRYGRYAYTGRPLQVAAVLGDVESAQLLLAAGARVNAATESGVTALLDAVVGGRPEMVGFLLEHGADPMAEDDYHRTPIGRARCMDKVMIDHQTEIYTMLLRAIEASGRDWPGP